ncbi:MAG: hypothetical protein MJ052_05555 [Sphaerochaetaceae bacterium]|nr:hypothetical protein [Sphaerochaetaceae bacterium]
MKKCSTACLIVAAVFFVASVALFIIGFCGMAPRIHHSGADGFYMMEYSWSSSMFMPGLHLGMVITAAALLVSSFILLLMSWMINPVYDEWEECDCGCENGCECDSGDDCSCGCCCSEKTEPVQEVEAEVVEAPKKTSVKKTAKKTE